MPDYKELLQITDSVEGLEVAEGAYKTSRGTIRIPKSKLKKMQKEASQETSKETLSTVSAQVPEREIDSNEELHVATGQSDRISFVTPLGTMTALYSPVIDLEGFVVLGLVPNSFVPTSYRENDKLRFTVKGSKLKECQAVFTGCKFTDPYTRATYIILMKT